MAGRGRLALLDFAGDALEGLGAAIGGVAHGIGAAAGGAMQGAGEALGGALQGALTPAPTTIINNVGMVGEAGKKRVSSGGGTIPAPKKTTVPAVNADMPTEKLLLIAVKYLSSIDKTLQNQINFERLALEKQIQAEKEAAIESNTGTDIFSRLGDKIGAVKQDAADKASAAGELAKKLVAGTALAGLGFLGLGALTAEQEKINEFKTNWNAFLDQYKGIIDLVNKIYDWIGDDALLAGSIGGFLFGWRGGLIGLIAGKVYELTGSTELATLAGIGTGALTTSAGRSIAGEGLKRVAGLAMRNPYAAAAILTTGSLLYSVDKIFKSTQEDVQTPYIKWYNKHGMYPKFSDNGLAVISFSIKMQDRNINVPAITPQVLASNNRESDQYYYWNQVRISGPDPRAKSEVDASNWLRTKGQKWLDSKYPKVAAAPVQNQGQGQPDAAPVTNPQGDQQAPGGKAEEAMAFFTSAAGGGWTREQAAGIVANLAHESRLDPNITGDGGKAYGLAQWHADRQANFQKVYNKPIQSSTFQEQLQFVNWELNNTESAAGRALRGARTAEEATRIISEKYERPGNPMMERRLGNASALMAGNYDAVGASGGYGGDGSSPAANLAGSVVDLASAGMKTFGGIVKSLGKEIVGERDYVPMSAQTADSAKAISEASARIENTMALGLDKKSDTSTDMSKVMKTLSRATPTNTIQAIDPSYGGGDTVLKYLQYHKLAKPQAMVMV